MAWQLIVRFWQDERGFLVSLETMLYALLLCFGMAVGMTVVRDATNQELTDLANAISAINISGSATPTTYSITTYSATFGNTTSESASS